MKLLLVILFFILSISVYLYGQGSLIEDKFFSKSLEFDRNVNVYLPENYDSSDKTKGYPVIYFLHGGGGNHNSYLGIIPILDSLIINKIIEPMIVVMPDGSCEPYLGSQYSNSELYGPFEDYITFDLVDYIDSKYNTIALKNKRAIMGHSMGGEGSMRIALKHPDRFAGIASHSGVLSIDFIDYLLPLVLAEMDSTNIIHPTNGWMSKAYFTVSGGYSPNMNNPPYFVDLPKDENGNWIDSTYAKWRLSDPIYWATQISNDSNLNIYFDCGLNDPIIDCTRVFANTLRKRDIPFEFQEFEGGHSDKFYERFPVSITFLDSVFKNDTNLNEYISFNHLYIVIDDSTYSNLFDSLKVLDDFSYNSEETVVTDDESWSGKYLFGEQHYLEIFNSEGFENAKFGELGLGFISEKTGTLDFIKRNWEDMKDSISFSERTIEYENKSSPWYYSLSIPNIDSLRVNAWLMEHHKEEMLRVGFTEEDINRVISWEEYIDYSLATSRNVAPDSITFEKSFHRIKGLHLTLTLNELELLKETLLSFGFTDDGICLSNKDLYLKYELTQNEVFILNQIDFELIKTLKPGIYRYRNWEFVIEGDSAYLYFLYNSF